MIPAGMVERGERTTERFEAALGKPLEAPALAKVTKIAQGLSWTGVAHLGVAVLVGDVPNAPREALTISSAFACKSLGPNLSEMNAVPATFDAVRAFRRLGARLIAVLTRTIPTPAPKLNCAVRSNRFLQNREDLFCICNPEELLFTQTGLPAGWVSSEL